MTLKAYQQDPYGCEGLLREKRVGRDPFAVGVPYYHRMPPKLRPLLVYCGSAPYPQPLPWDPRVVIAFNDEGAGGQVD